MDEIFINTYNLPEWLVKKYFNEKDFYSIEELIAIIEDLDENIERLQEDIDDIRQDIEDNYRFIPMSKQVGISDKDFI